MVNKHASGYYPAIPSPEDPESRNYHSDRIKNYESLKEFINRFNPDATELKEILAKAIEEERLTKQLINQWSLELHKLIPDYYEWLHEYMGGDFTTTLDRQTMIDGINAITQARIDGNADQ